MKPTYSSGSWLVACSLLGMLLLTAGQVHAQTANVRNAKQGYSMRLTFDNRGTFGRVAYAGVIGGIDPGPDSIGLAYPIGQPYEHVFGAGFWVGGKLDTAQSGTSTPIRLVTTGYEGWAGPYFEFFPGFSPADSIWKVTGRGVPRPQSWNAYWGNLIPAVSFSDNDHYCLYDDARVRVAAHVPLKLKVVQSSYVWNDPYAEAIHIMEYKIMNMGAKRIDSAYVGIFLEGDVGPYHTSNYYQRNYSAYYANVRTAYIHNPVDLGSTPVGIALLSAPRPLDSLQTTFRWWQGPSHPGTDVDRYARLSSGIIQPDEFPNLSDTKLLLGCGPFVIRPGTDPIPDTLVFAFGIVSGQNLSVMRQQADRARIIYASGGVVGVKGGSNEIPTRFELFQNYPNPFNPTTIIQFALPKAVAVKLTVFDIRGRQVAELVNQGMAAGVHSAVWDAAGHSSGLYFYTLQSGSFVETRKLILLR
jgi:hypothetical protein